MLVSGPTRRLKKLDFHVSKRWHQWWWQQQWHSCTHQQEGWETTAPLLIPWTILNLGHFCQKVLPTLMGVFLPQLFLPGRAFTELLRMVYLSWSHVKSSWQPSLTIAQPKQINALELIFEPRLTIKINVSKNHVTIADFFLFDLQYNK